MYKVINEHFREIFYKPGVEKIEPFDGPPRPLNNEITVDEVDKNIKKLNNRRSPGFDHISAELIKYSTPELTQCITTALNSIFENNKDQQVGKGILAPIQKANKTKGPKKNLRPITLLPILRKILSNITMSRIQGKIYNFLSENQSAYRAGRSTSDIIWAYRWICARMQVCDEEILVTGIDMSSAFDTIIRKNLLNIFGQFLNSDEMRLVKILLTNTSLEVKMNGVENFSFESNIGSPQGDGSSGPFFNVYFENSLRKLRSKMSEIPNTPDDIPTIYNNIVPASNLPDELTYADDCDFITQSETKRSKLNEIVGKTLLEDNLIVNIDKTEHTTIKRIKNDKNAEVWRHTKKLGSLLGDSEDIARRKQLSIVALNNLNNIWIRKDKIRETLRIKLYNALVKPVLIYNCSTWGLTNKDEQQLDTFHRKQLKRIIKIKYPHRISNKHLYERCDAKPLSLEILRQRWQKFGHILRLGEEIPAYKSMIFYFDFTHKQRFQGHPRTTIVVTLDNDIKRARKDPNFRRKYVFIRQHSSNFLSKQDIETFCNVAKDRERWKKITNDLYFAAEAEKSL